MGFSFQEINHIKLQDYRDLVDLYIEANEIPQDTKGKTGGKRRKATPQEVSAFFGGVG